MVDGRTKLELARLRREPLPSPAPPPPAKPKTLAEAVAPFLPLIQALVVLGLGYWLVQRVELGFKQNESALRASQHAIDATKSLQDLLQKIYTAEPQDRERAVIQVAMHGEAAIYPLFVLAVSKNPYPAEAVTPGLRLLAVRHRSQVCELLRQGLQVPQAVNALREVAIRELTQELCVTGATGVRP